MNIRLELGTRLVGGWGGLRRGVIILVDVGFPLVARPGWE